MDYKIKNMKEFSGMFFFELVIGGVLGIRGFKIRVDMEGEYELVVPQYKSKKGWKDSAILYDEGDTYDRILEKALMELAKITGDNEVIK